MIAVSTESHLHRKIRSIREIDSRLLDEIEAFFIAYNKMKGVRFKPLGRFGPARAMKLIARGLKKAQKG